MIFLWRRQAITTASIHLDQSLPHKLRLMLWSRIRNHGEAGWSLSLSTEGAPHVWVQHSRLLHHLWQTQPQSFTTWPIVRFEIAAWHVQDVNLGFFCGICACDVNTCPIAI
jgi:hypothetical protein